MSEIFGFISKQQVHNPLRPIGFHFHKWSKWEQYERHKTYYGTFDNPKKEGINYPELRQKRYCIICNFVQDQPLL